MSSSAEADGGVHAESRESTAAAAPASSVLIIVIVLIIFVATELSDVQTECIADFCIIIGSDITSIDCELSVSIILSIVICSAISCACS